MPRNRSEKVGVRLSKEVLHNSTGNVRFVDLMADCDGRFRVRVYVGHVTGSRYRDMSLWFASYERALGLFTTFPHKFGWGTDVSTYNGWRTSPEWYAQKSQ